MLSFILVPIYTKVMATEAYGEVSVIFSWFAIFNVFLAYGMETAFFRFYSSSEHKEKVISTSLISILGTTLVFVMAALIFQDALASILDIDPKYILYVITILGLDALVIVPFAWLRATEQPMQYAIVKITNVTINLGLTIFFLLLLPGLAESDSESIFNSIYKSNFEISYIFIANLIASGITLIMMFKLYMKSSYVFDVILWKKMLQYSVPIMLAGVAYTINEVFDKILLERLLPQDIAQSEVGKYAACYKLALFMTLFATAFRMGVEPFFFSHSKSENPQKAYAQITNYFVILGSVILLAVVVFADVLKVIFIQNKDYWEAMPVVPIIVLASFFLGIYHNLSVWYKVTDRTKIGAYISFVGAALTIVINYTFISYFGYMASAVATLVAYSTMLFLSFYFGKMYYPIPYNLRKIVFYLLISILFSILSFYIFDRNLIIGVLFLSIFLGLVYKLENATLKQLFFKK